MMMTVENSAALFPSPAHHRWHMVLPRGVQRSSVKPHFKFIYLYLIMYAYNLFNNVLYSIFIIFYC